MFYKKYLFLFFLILISIIPLADLVKPGLPLTHDGQDHVARIANFYQNLSEGVIIPRWAGNLNWGYGHPILEFLYPLPSYLASLFYFLGFTLVDSVKLVFGISFVLSSISMFIFIKELLKDEKIAFFAGLLYVLAPYRFVDLYVRGALGEHIAFVFPPLVFYFFLKLSKHYSWWYIMGGAITFALLNLSHNAISLMFIPLFGLYAVFLLLQSKNKIQLGTYYLTIIFLGIGLSAFFLVPAFMEGKYTLRDIVTGGGEYAGNFVMWRDFFYSEWNYGGSLILSKQVGIIHWIGVVASVIAVCYLYMKKNKLWIMGLSSFLIFWMALFLMTSSSDPIWQKISMLQKFQFPWRFLSLTVFLSTLLSAIAFSLISSKFKGFFLLIFIASLLFVNKDYWHARDFLHKQNSFYTGVYNSTTDTGESGPIWSVRFMEKRPKSKFEIISGKGEIKEIERRFTKREYKAVALERIRILENTLYFPGWTVLIDGRKTQIEFQDQNYRGLITFYVDKGEHIVDIVYRETKVRFLANIMSLLSLVIIGSFVVLKLIRRKIYNRK